MLLIKTYKLICKCIRLNQFLNPSKLVENTNVGNDKRRGGVGGQWKMGGGQMGKVRSGPEGQLGGVRLDGWVGGDS